MCRFVIGIRRSSLNLVMVRWFLTVIPLEQKKIRTITPSYVSNDLIKAHDDTRDFRERERERETRDFRERERDCLEFA
jgi:hypothetical protein